MQAVKYSRQRDAILQYLTGNTAHPTADMVYTAVRKKNPHISLGTVYRNLAQLESMGSLQKITIQGEPDRFDFRTEPHDHFICGTCGCVSDIEMPDTAHLDQEARRHFDGEILGHHCCFYGTCRDCLAKKLENRALL